MRNLTPLFAVGVLAGALYAAEPPVVTSITPSPLVTSPDAQTLRVTGTGFAAGLTAEVTLLGNTQTFSGGALKGQSATTFEIAMVLPQPGAASLIVRNTDGGVSDPFVFKVEPAPSEPAPKPPTPVIGQVAPDRVSRSTVAQVLTLSGRGFLQSLTVTMTDPAGVVTVLGRENIEAVTADSVRFNVVLNVSGEFNFTVANPRGQASNTVTVAVM